MKYKVTHDIANKRTEQCECQSFEDMNNWIDKTFNIEIKNIKFKKPRIKDQATFKKQVKEGVEVLILGQARKQQKKQKTEQQIQKQRKHLEMIEKMRQQLKMTPHQKILKKLNQQGIKQRGIQYYNKQTQKIQQLGVEYATSPLHLLKSVPQFKKYCHQYKVMQKNPDGLIIQELSTIFNEMDKGQGVVCPLEFITAWVTYCADQIQFPYPTYQMNFFLRKTFQTIKNAFDIELEKKEQQPNSRIDPATKIFGMEVLTKRTDLTNLDQDDKEQPKQIDKKVIKYVLQCDLSKPIFNTLIAGIKDRWEERILWRNYYAFDIQYKQKILTFQRLPKYFFVHATRFGYAPAKQQCQQIDLYEHKKSYHKVRYGRIIDLFQFCDANLKERLQLGRYERHQMFYPYDADPRYAQFRKKIPNIEQYADTQIRYLYFDSILQKENVFHNFCFQPLRNSKPTGEYRMVGVIMHKGDYYHHVNPSHNHNCIGQFQTFVYSNGRKWIKYHKAEVEYVDIDEVMNEKYWGKQGQFTPVLFLYRQIYMKNMVIQAKDAKKPRKPQPKKEQMQN